MGMCNINTKEKECRRKMASNNVVSVSQEIHGENPWLHSTAVCFQDICICIVSVSLTAWKCVRHVYVCVDSVCGRKSGMCQDIVNPDDQHCDPVLHNVALPKRLILHWVQIPLHCKHLGRSDKRNNNC